MVNLIDKLPLRVILAVSLVIIIVATGGTAGYLADRNRQHAVNGLASQLHKEIAARIQQQLDAYLATPLFINQLNLDGIRLRQLDVHNLDAMEQHFLAQIQRFDSVISLAYANEQREYAGASRKVLGLDLTAARASAKTNHNLEAYAITPQGGREPVGAVPAYDPRPRPWYRMAVQTGQPAWTPIFLWSSGDVGIDAVVPVYSEDDRLIGVLDTSLTLKGIGDFLQGLQASKHGEIFIIDKSGLLVAASTIKEPFLHIGNDVQRLSALESGDPVAQAATRYLERQFGGLANITSSQQFSFDLPAGQQFAQVTPYRDPYGLDWLIITVIPESDLMAQIDANNRGTALLIAVSLLLSGVIAVLIVRWATQPLVRLSQSAKALAGGNWMLRVVVDRGNEVGELARSFNSMAQQLQNSFASLQASEERYRGIFEGVPVGLYRTTPGGTILDVNPASVRMLGYPDRGSLRTIKATDLYVHPEDRQRWQSMMEYDGSMPIFEIQVRRRDGAIIWVRNSARAIRDADGQVVYYEGSFEDITERKQAEEQLRQAQKMEALGRLASGIAHDFNNLLTVILGSVELLLADSTDVQILHEDAERIRQAARRAAGLTCQLLAFSRQQVLEPHCLDINAVVVDMTQLLKPLIGEDIELVTRLAPDLGSLYADSGQLEQVIMNLAVNARDAMSGGGTLTIATANVTLYDAQVGAHSDVERGSYIMLTISDTGVGMDAATRARIFEPFFTTKAIGKGTGLGLATVHGIVTQSGGHIWVDSEPGRGTTFKIYLPRVDTVEQFASAASPPAVAPHGDATILLVEDEPLLRKLAARVLRRHGYQVLEAEDGPMALRVAAKFSGPIDLLLTDVILSGRVSGPQLAEQVIAQRPAIKVLYMSGYTDTMITQALFTSGQAFVPKPFTPDALRRKVWEVVRR